MFGLLNLDMDFFLVFYFLFGFINKFIYFFFVGYFEQDILNNFFWYQKFRVIFSDFQRNISFDE